MDCLLLVENLYICSSKLTCHYEPVYMQLAGEVIPLLPEITHLTQNISYGARCTLMRVVLNIICYTTVCQPLRELILELKLVDYFLI